MQAHDIVLNATQAFQLVALGPCLFVILYLFVFSFRKFSSVIIPILFFISLSASFLMPILSILVEFSENLRLVGTFVLLENSIPEISFLLIMQCMLGKPPPWQYWLILAVPFVGGGSFTYLALTEQEVCVTSGSCYRTDYIMLLYRVFGAALVFMLLTYFIHRQLGSISLKDVNRRQKYWLIITIVAFNLISLGIDLALIAEEIEPARALFIKTVIGATFVYLVLSSIFRVFAESFGMQGLKPIPQWEFTDKDQNFIDQMEQILQIDKPYRKLGFNRAALADMMEVTEHYLSRVINYKYKKSFSELMNEYRIAEAKQRLVASDEAITTISFDVGFSSLTSFNRVFKEATELAPSDYREKNKKN